MRFIRSAVPIAMAAAFAATPCLAQSKNHEASEKTIQLSEVPKAARDAAQKELGMAPTEAKLVNGTSPQEYELEAKSSAGKEVAVHVRADGTVVKKEKE